MADREALVKQFTNVTGADEGRARFFLESSNWDAELAIATFFENGGHEEGEDPVVVEDDEPEAVPMGTGHLSTGPPTGNQDRKPAAASKNSRFATLASMRANEQSSSEEEEGEAFYAGGSDRSGQQVLGPPKKKKNPAEDLFKSAREHGATPVEPEQPVGHRSVAFRGAGYRLGETDDQSAMVSGPPVRERRQVDMTLKLYRNGFTVDDGELRDHKDPANREFIEAISRGEVPQELMHLARGKEVNLNMEDHRHEDYSRPKGSVKVFSGAGHMLGSPAPNVVTSASATSGSGSNSKSSATSATSVNVDESKPTTNVQIRLADGSRMVLKLNHTHTIQDIRKYIVDQCSRYAASEFVLMTTFPNKELTNEEQTLADAQLLNAVIVQKMK